MLIANTGQSLVVMNLRTGEQVQLPPGQRTPVLDSKIPFIDDSFVLISLFNAGVLVAYTDAGAAYPGFPTTANPADSKRIPPVDADYAAAVVGAAYGGVVLAQMSGAAAALSIIASPAGVGSGFNPVYLELFDFANSGVQVGDQVVTTLDWNFPLAATTDRTIQWGIGVNTAGYSSVRSRTPPTGQTRIKMVVTINVVSATFARTSTDMYADAASPYRVYNDVNTLNIATQKVYVRAYVGDTAHAASDSIYLWDASVVRYPRRPA